MMPPINSPQRSSPKSVLKQSDTPLFPDILWSRPENRMYAGRLLIIGGNDHAFSAPAAAYKHASEAGIGSIRTILPDSVKKLLKSPLYECEFAPSTPSGSFSRMSLQTLLAETSWSEGVLFPGDLGRNSETAILLESYLQKLSTPAVLTRDAFDYLITMPAQSWTGKNLYLIGSLAQIQKLGMHLKFPEALTYSMNFQQVVDWLQRFSVTVPLSIALKHHKTIFVASKGSISATKLTADEPIWRNKAASYVATFIIQQPERPFEAMTTAIYEAFNIDTRHKGLAS